MTWRKRKGAGRRQTLGSSCGRELRRASLTVFVVVAGVLWYAGERGLPGGLGREPDGAEHHEDGPVPVHHGRRRPAAAGAGGVPALSVGGALSEG